MRIRPAQPEDAPGVARIYNHAIVNSVASFWAEPRPDEELAGLIAHASPPYPWLVAEVEAGNAAPGPVLGTAWSKQWNPRDAYRSTIEISVYVAPESHGMGIGRALYTSLFALLRAAGHRSTIAMISLPNPASVRLHESFGMRPLGTIREAGFKHGRWVDVGLWQGMLAEGAAG